ncbi:hypothetical protein [Dyadobacter bucti]|uniref:hypothetical protein n=1 Tax=Dyadobacter bucti TaxID=2572203 RepID=UPI003F703136
MKIKFITTLLLIYNVAAAQIKFTYDEAGNRISRKLDGALVQLNVKVYLRGACRAGKPNMANDLQIYYGPSSGLLPGIDPYGSGVVYNNISNPAAVTGEVVDWVKIEVRSAANPAVVSQSRSLLLKSNGNVVDTDGTLPEFLAEATPVHVVVKHRNHIAIMGNAIPAFVSGTVNYDFTSSLAMAYNVPGDPPQMGVIEGKWAMWPADVNQDYVVDGVDNTIVVKAFNQGLFDDYLASDLNLNGVVEGLDGSMMNNAFNTGYFSVLLNYEPL